MNLGSPEWKAYLKEGANKMGINVPPDKINQLTLHATELLKWNQKINLTAITDPLEIAVKHFLDSMSPSSIIPKNASLIDIGSGGGFPGIVLKVLIPSLSVTLIDSSRKKVNFLKHVIRMLDLKNIDAHQDRVENLGKYEKFTKSFDIAISRAFSKIDIFIGAVLPLLSSSGIILAMKGKNVEEELEALNSLFSSLSPPSRIGRFQIQISYYTLPYIESERSIIMVK